MQARKVASSSTLGRIRRPTATTVSAASTRAAGCNAATAAAFSRAVTMPLLGYAGATSGVSQGALVALAIGLAIVVVYNRNRGSIAVDDINLMKG